MVVLFKQFEIAQGLDTRGILGGIGEFACCQHMLVDGNSGIRGVRRYRGSPRVIGRLDSRLENIVPRKVLKGGARGYAYLCQRRPVHPAVYSG